MLESSSQGFIRQSMVDKTLERNGVNIGILGYNWVGVDKFPCADNWTAQSRDSLVNYTWNRDSVADARKRKNPASRNSNVIRDIRSLRKVVDFLVLSAHWGFEFVHSPPYGVMVEDKTFLEAGADLIIGHHPHVIQGVEIYQGKHVFYSMGNFVLDMHSQKTRRSVILKYTLKPAGHSDYQFMPVVIDSTYRPRRVDEKPAESIQHILTDSSATIRAAWNDKRLLHDDTIYQKHERQYSLNKLRHVVDHFAAIAKNPRILLLIVEKTLNAAKLIANRLQGKKVRW